MNIHNITRDSFGEIVKYLNFESLANLCATNKYFSNLCTNEILINKYKMEYSDDTGELEAIILYDWGSPALSHRLYREYLKTIKLDEKESNDIFDVLVENRPIQWINEFITSNVYVPTVGLIQTAISYNLYDIAKLILKRHDVKLSLNSFILLMDSIDEEHLNILFDSQQFNELNRYDKISLSLRYDKLELLKTLTYNFDIDFHTALAMAIENNSIKIVTYLLDKYNMMIDNNVKIAFFSAIRLGYYDMVKLMLDRTDINSFIPGKDALYDAIYYNSPNIIKLLLQYVQIQIQDYKLLVELAVNNNNENILNNLIDYHLFDPNDYDLLTISASRGYTNIVRKLMIDKRVDPSAHDNLALKYAWINNSVDVINLLLTDHRVRELDNTKTHYIK